MYYGRPLVNLSIPPYLVNATDLIDSTMDSRTPPRSVSPDTDSTAADMQAVATAVSCSRAAVARVIDQGLELKESLVKDLSTNYKIAKDAVPQNPEELGRVIAQTELPAFITHAPILLGLFVPPPAWPPERLKVIGPRVAATAGAFVLLVTILVGGLGLLLAILLPVLIILFPALLLIGAALYSRRSQQAPRKTSARAGSVAEDIREAQALLDDVCPDASTAFNAHVKGATSLAVCAYSKHMNPNPPHTRSVPNAPPAHLCPRCPPLPALPNAVAPLTLCQTAAASWPPLMWGVSARSSGMGFNTTS